MRRRLPLLTCAHWLTLLLGDSQYKTRLTKNDTRSFHRPALQFPANIALNFTKVRSSKKKKDKTGRKIKKSDGEALRSMGDITCRDTSNFVLWEYSVRLPPSPLSKRACD